MPAAPELLQRITTRPEVFDGKPILRDLRLSVGLILSLLCQCATREGILGDYPELNPEDLRACLAYAYAGIAGDALDAISGAAR